MIFHRSQTPPLLALTSASLIVKPDLKTAVLSILELLPFFCSKKSELDKGLIDKTIYIYQTI